MIAATVVAELLRQPAAGTHITQHHDIKQREEYFEIALRCHPQLDVAEALKGGHQLHKTAGVRQHAEHGYRLCEQRQHDTHNHTRYREQQQRAIGETELQSEQDGERHCYPHYPT